MRTILLTSLLISALAPATVRAQDELPAGVVLAIGGVDGDAALAAAREAGGARWRLERLEPAEARPEAAPSDAVDALEGHYLAADFLRCLAALQSPALALDALVEHGHRALAARVGVLGAGCALGAEDPGLAERLLERLYVAGLDPARPLAVTTPEMQALAESVRQRVLARERITVEVQTEPSLAAASADGGGERCEPTPCPMTLVPGRHLITVTHLGYAPRTVTSELESAGAITIALDPAVADAVRAQLAVALGEGAEPGDVAVTRAAAMAFEARVVAVTWSTGSRIHAAVFDRPRDRVVARVAVSGGDGAATATRSAVEEWRGVTEPTPLLEQPLFWVATVGAAAAVGVAVFFAVRPAERRYDVVFGAR